MESVYLKTLVEVVRTGNLSRAAEVLRVTQPAVSRRIKFMEDQYGYALLDRSGPQLRPTEAGKLVYEKAETLLEIEAELIAGLHVLGGKTRIAFGSSPSFGIAHLPAILKDFMLTHAESADLKFMFDMPDQILEGLSEGLFDLAVMELCDCFDLSAYRTFPLPDDEMVFVSAPGLGIPHPETTVDALLGVPLFTRREGCCSRILLETNLERVSRELRDFHKLIVFDDLHVVVKAVLDGEGLSFLSRDVLGEHLASGRLIAHHVSGFRHSRSRAVVLSRPGIVEGPLADFVTTLFDHFDIDPPAELVAGRPRGAAATALPTGVSRRRVGRASRRGVAAR
jgi:DNA-binding transcriptional LysR family regulator